MLSGVPRRPRHRGILESGENGEGGEGGGGSDEESEFGLADAYDPLGPRRGWSWLTTRGQRLPDDPCRRTSPPKSTRRARRPLSPDIPTRKPAWWTSSVAPLRGE